MRAMTELEWFWKRSWLRAEGEKNRSGYLLTLEKGCWQENLALKNYQKS